jgi:hypothetical protein
MIIKSITTKILHTYGLSLINVIIIAKKVKNIPIINQTQWLKGVAPIITLNTQARITIVVMYYAANVFTVGGSGYTVMRDDGALSTPLMTNTTIYYP